MPKTCSAIAQSPHIISSHFISFPFTSCHLTHLISFLPTLGHPAPHPYCYNSPASHLLSSNLKWHHLISFHPCWTNNGLRICPTLRPTLHPRCWFLALIQGFYEWLEKCRCVLVVMSCLCSFTCLQSLLTLKSKMPDEPEAPEAGGVAPGS